MVGRSALVIISLLCGTLLLSGCAGSEAQKPIMNMGSNAMPMAERNDPDFRVVEGQVMEIDTATGVRGGLSVLLRGRQVDWMAAEERMRSLSASWSEIRMELEGRSAEHPEIRFTQDRFDWDMNVLDGSIRSRDQAGATSALADLLGSWAQVKSILKQPVVDGWRVITILLLLAASVLILSDALLWLQQRLDRRFMRPGKGAGKTSRIVEPVSGGSGSNHGGPATQLKLAEHQTQIRFLEMKPASTFRYSFDLLSLKPVAALAKSRYMPITIQVFLVLLFAYTVWASFVVKMEMADSNFGLTMFWSVFWPTVIMLSLVTVGKVWCSVCPLGAISAAAQRLGLNRPFPRVWSLRSGIVALALYIGVVWLIREPFGVTDSGPLTGWLFVAFTVAAVAFGLVFEKRAWCQYACPIGVISGLWSMLSFLELRPTKEKCEKCRTFECVRGNGEVLGCQMGLHPGRLESNRDCTLCMNCVKACPHGSPRLRLRWPGAELVRGKRRSLVDAGFALTAVVVFCLKENMEHYWTPPFLVSATTWGANLLGTTNRQGVWFVLVVAFNGALLLGAYLLATRLASRALTWPFWRTFATFSYALVPVIVVTVGGHSINAIFTMYWGPMVSLAAAPLGIYMYVEPSLAGPELTKFLQDGFVRPVLYAIGFGWMIALPYRIAMGGTSDQRLAIRAAVPYSLVALAVAAFFIGSHMVFTGGGWRW